MRHISNVQIERVVASCSAQHALFVSTAGDIYAYGENTHGQCGVMTNSAITEAVRLEKDAFSPHLGSNERVVSGAVGASHTLLVTSRGSVYAAGDNSLGQCGLGDTAKAAPFTRLAKFDSAAVQVSCGHDFSLVLTQDGGVYAMGSAAYGQLGTGKYDLVFNSAEASFAMEKEPVKVAELPPIKQIACGMHHALALDNEGYAYAWGQGNYGRLGTGSQRNCRKPMRLQQFVRKNRLDRVRAVAAGAYASAVIDQRHRLWVVGRWRVYGAGGYAENYQIFRPFKELHDKEISAVALGSDAMHCLAAEKKGTPKVYGWGERAGHGVLGMGATLPPGDPTICPALEKVQVIQIAAGMNTAYWLAQPSGTAYSELLRFPEMIESPSTCLVCGQGSAEDPTLLECDRCESPFHLACLKPPLEAIPDGEWLCEKCTSHPRKRRRT
ncbi:hypothetical protein MCUN1_001719 [Malassezia cuniculi]|uniref:PHD-type domain-containing protein n=1 Tax=Malassezia cuniculi TaxID=948313 RepID=A0AAF0J6A1_9BASI|nr:hypothetical protein MCUN1_001719 [Malassezia cuniculi]